MYNYFQIGQECVWLSINHTVGTPLCSSAHFSYCLSQVDIDHFMFELVISTKHLILLTTLVSKTQGILSKI